MAANPQIPLPPKRKALLVPSKAPAPPARGHRVLAGLIGLALVFAMLVYVWRVRDQPRPQSQVPLPFRQTAREWNQNWSSAISR